MEIFTCRLRMLRNKESQASFARKLGLTQATYSRYESGAREPDLATLCQIGKVCGVSIDWLLGLVDDAPTSIYNPRFSFAEDKLRAVKSGLQALLSEL